MGRKRLPRQTGVRKQIVSEIAPRKGIRDCKISLDLSSRGAFSFVEYKGFTNKLQSFEEFEIRLVAMYDFARTIKYMDFSKELISGKGWEHCHVIANLDKIKLIKDCVLKSMEYTTDTPSKIWDQYYEGEKLYQIGQSSGARYIGVFDESSGVFHVLLIDWHHLIFPSDKGSHKKDYKNLKYSVIKHSQ